MVWEVLPFYWPLLFVSRLPSCYCCCWCHVFLPLLTDWTHSQQRVAAVSTSTLLILIIPVVEGPSTCLLSSQQQWRHSGSSARAFLFRWLCKIWEARRSVSKPLSTWDCVQMCEFSCWPTGLWRRAVQFWVDLRRTGRPEWGAAMGLGQSTKTLVSNDTDEGEYAHKHFCVWILYWLEDQSPVLPVSLS